MKNRIFNNWKSTTLGALILLGTFVLLGMKAITLETAMIFIPMGLGLGYVKDSVFKIK